MPHVSRSEVFIVDDEPISCELLSAIFTAEGYRVTSFEEGTSFLAAARHRAPALILLDINMPSRSGLDVLKGAGRTELSGAGFHDFRTDRYPDRGQRH